MRNILVTLVVAGAVACASAPSEPDSQAVVGAAAVKPHPASEWRELRSPHFTLTTDFGPKEAREVLEHLETIRSALLVAGWGGPKLEGDHLSVIDLVQHGEFAEFSDENLGGFTSVTGEGTVIVMSGRKLEQQTLFAHELTHALAARLIPRKPLWLNEGLACFLSTVKLREDDTKVQMGEVSIDYVKALHHSGRMPMAKLLAMKPSDYDPDAPDLSKFYATVWLLTHYLANTHGVAFRKYQSLLAHDVPFDAAWYEAFPELTPDKLDQELTLYLQYGEYHVLEAPFTPPPLQILQETELTEAQAHAVRANLFLIGMSRRTRAEKIAKAQAELGPAEAAAPDDPRVVEVEAAWLPKDEVLALARHSTQAHPDSARAWRTLADAILNDPSTQAKSELLDALARAAKLEPNDPHLLNDFAWELLTNGRASEALAPAEHAVQLLPDPFILDTLANVTMALGHCAEALALEERAVLTMPPEQARRRADLQRNQSRMQQACAGRPPELPKQP